MATMNYRREKVIPSTRDDLILERLADLKDGQHELRQEIKTTRQEIKDVQHVMRHSQIMTASVVGIALAVIYFVCTR